MGLPPQSSDLLLIPTPLRAQTPLTVLNKGINQSVYDAQNLKSTEHSPWCITRYCIKPMLYITCTALVVISVALYYTANIPAQQRYQPYIGALSNAFIIGGMGTNFLFNTFSVITMWLLLSLPKSPYESIIPSSLGQKLIQFMTALLTGAASVLPVWLIGNNSTDQATNTLNTFASLVNLPVYALGSMFLIWWLRKQDLPFRLDTYFEKNAAIKMERYQQLGNKKKLVVQLHAKKKSYIYASPEEKNQFIQTLEKKSNPFQFILEHKFTGSKVPEDIEIKNSPTRQVIYYGIALCAIMQQAGWTTESYKATDSLFSAKSNSFIRLSGCILTAILNTVPGLGYATKGMRGVKTFLTNKAESLSQRHAPKLFFSLIFCIRILVLFSGGSTDEANYQAFKLYNLILANVWALMANVGIAFAYNLVPCQELGESIVRMLAQRTFLPPCHIKFNEEKKKHHAIDRCFSDLIDTTEQLHPNTTNELLNELKPTAKSGV